MSIAHRLFLIMVGTLAATGARSQCPLQWSATSEGIADAAPWSDGDAIVVGDFTSLGGVAANRVARLQGNTVVPFGTGLDAPASHVAVMLSGDVLVAGSFTTAGGVVSPGLARWDGAAWHAHPGAPLGPVEHLIVLPNDDIYVARNVSASPTTGYVEISRFDGAGWTVVGTSSGSTGAQPFAEVKDLVALSNGTVVAVGTWAAMNPMGTPGPTGYRELVAWNGATWDYFYDAPSPEALLETRQGDLFLACSSTSAGIHHRRAGAWLGPATTNLGEVMALAELPTGEVLAAGPYTGQPWQMGCRRWNGTTWSDFGFWTPGAQGDIGFLFAHMRTGRLYAAGAFTAAGGIPAAGRVWVATPCPAAVVSTPTACVGPAGPIETATLGLPWTGTRLITVAGWFPPTAAYAVVTVLGATPTVQPLAAVLPTPSAGCDLLVTPDVLLLGFPAIQHYVFLDIPAVPALAGTTIYQQTGQLEIGATGILSASVSNRLTLVVGTF